MAQLEKLTGTLQENCITLLAHSDQYGKLVAKIIDPQLFEGEYRTIAERCVDYWRRHAQAPKYHTPDLVADILDDKANRRSSTIKRILSAMLELSEFINAPYVVDQLQNFSRMQRIKAAILASAEQLTAQEQVAIPEVERIWHELLRSQTDYFDPGLTLNDYGKLIEYLQRQYAEFVTGIPQLDQRRIVPARGTVMLILAGAKKGKSWFLNHVAKHGIMQRKRVCVTTLEMDAEQNLQRFYQSLFAITYDEASYDQQRLKFDRHGNLSGIERDSITPSFMLTDKNIAEELEAHVSALGGKANLLRIKRFPIRSLTVDALEGYLDSLEITEGFIPDMLVLDYIGIMKTDPKNHRISLGRAFEDFRSLCVRKNIAGVTAHQISRAGAEALQASSTHIAEDWSMIGTADIILSYSATAAERQLGLGRLWVNQARGARDSWGVILTQNYTAGQFVIESTEFDPSYHTLLKDLGAEDTDPDDDSYDDDGDQ